MVKRQLCIFVVLILIVGILAASLAEAQTPEYPAPGSLGGEPPDFPNVPVWEGDPATIESLPTFTAEVGTNTVTGMLTSFRSQDIISEDQFTRENWDSFNVEIPDNMVVTNISFYRELFHIWNGMDLFFVGCGIDSPAWVHINFSLSSIQTVYPEAVFSGCTLTFFVEAEYTWTTYAYPSGGPWRVTINTFIPPPPPPFVLEVSVPGDITVEATGPSGATVNYQAGSNVPDGGSFGCQRPSGSTFPIGTTQVTCTATDPDGNTASETFRVTVQDTTPPELLFSAPIPLYIRPDPGLLTGTPNFPLPLATDTVGVASVVCDPAGNAPFPVGLTLVYCTATDFAGNAKTKLHYTVTVDNELPVIVAPDITVEPDPGTTTALVNIAPTSSDNVGLGTLYYEGLVIRVIYAYCTTPDQDPQTTPIAAYRATPFAAVYPVGETTVACAVWDLAGNIARKTFTVTVADTIAPTWTVPADMTVAATELAGAVVSYPAAASDEVGVVSANCVPPSGSAFPVGLTTVTCTATDAAGNIGTAAFNVTVELDSSAVNILTAGIIGFGLPAGVENSLLGPLNQVHDLFSDDNPDNDEAGCAKLGAFLGIVERLLEQGRITPTQASLMTNFATAVRNYHGCP